MRDGSQQSKPNVMNPFTPKHLTFSVSEAKRKQGVYCCAYGCRKPPNAKKRGLCHCHYKRHRKMIDPVYDRWAQFAWNAKQRDIECSVTLPEFRKFCLDNNYIISKGRRGRAATIDRKDNRYGYHIWNLQILSGAANIDKYYDHDRYMMHDDFNPEDLPF
jgi:hypothetical protein